MSKTVWAYVNTSKQVGDAEHIKVLRMPTPRRPWFAENGSRGRGL
jgi:hypothetical protein